MGERAYRRSRYPGIYEVVGGKDKRYVVSYRVRGLGQKTKTLPTLREAREFQGSMRDPVKQARVRELQRGRVQLAEYFPAWLERRRNLTPSTRLRYDGVGRNYIVTSRLGRLPISGITRDDVEDWVTDLERRFVPAPTIDKAYRTLRACLETAALEGKALANPAKRIALPDQERREPFFLTADQVDAVANDVSPRQRALVYFLAYTGLRMGEATALRVRNLDLLRATVLVAESSAEVGGRKLPAAKTKTKTVRAVNLSPPLVAELSTHLDTFGPRMADGGLDPDGWVFTAERGQQVRQNNWRVRVFQRSCVRQGVVRGPRGAVQPPRVHDLRHTAASLAARAGYSIHEVKEMLGHSTIKTTSDLYLHLFDDTKREHADQLGGLMIAAATERGRVVTLPTRPA